MIIYSNYETYIRDAAKDDNVPYVTAKSLVDSVFDKLSTDIANGKTVTVPKLGSFSTKEYNSHRIKDINTGEYRVLPATKKVRYNPNKWILTRINK